MSEIEYKVGISATNWVTHDVKRFVVEKPDDYKFTPGQATEVSINKPSFKGEKRPFTFTSTPTDGVLEFTIKIYPVDKHDDHEGVTEELSKLKAGDELIVRDSWGTIHYEKPGVFIAGGAGITPFISIFRDLNNKNILEGNGLIFSNKTRKDIILEQELRAYFSDNDLDFIISENEGRIDKKYLEKNINEFEKHFYVCGKRDMVNELREVLVELGASEDNIIFEK